MHPLTFLSRIPLAPLVLVLAIASAVVAATPEQTTRAVAEIDALLAAHWKANGLKANALASDEVFVRRVYLDVIGRIPTAREAAAFLDAKEADKRTRLIDLLLASEGYVHHFYNVWEIGRAHV